MEILRIINKFRSILSNHHKQRIFELAILMVIAGFLEMISASLVIPFMGAILRPSALMEKHLVKVICNLFGIQSERSFLTFLAIILAALYIFKNLFLIFEMTAQCRFVYSNMFLIQTKLLQCYLERPYEYYLSINSGEVLRIIQNDTENAFSMMTILLQLFSEMVVSIALIVMIFILSPGVTIVMAVILFGMVLILGKFIRPAMRRVGLININVFTKMNQWIIQSINGIKVIKVMRKEKFFEEAFSQYGGTYVHTKEKQVALSLTPRFMIEAFVMGSFFLMVAVMIYNGRNFISVIPMLSSVAVASVRLLPAINRISQSMGNLSFGEPALDKMIENLKQMDMNGDEYSRMTTYSESKEWTLKDECLKDYIKLENISYRYPQRIFNILVDANLSIAKGQTIGIVGASGQGKTTTVDLMLGLLLPQTGVIYANGVNIHKHIDQWRGEIGYVPQDIFVLDGDIRENVAFGVKDENIDENRVWKVLKDAALDEYVKVLPKQLFTEIGERGIRLSGGQIQRLGIARALYPDPSILFFDEATSALDNETEENIMEAVNGLRGSKTIIIIAHRLSTIEVCDMVYRLKDGKLIKER